MRIRFLQHVAFEGPAALAGWAAGRGNPTATTALFDGEPLPPLDKFDWLVVLGGPMNIYEEEAHPWLVAEKRLIKQAVEGGKVVLGICLGAQLIADALGAEVRPGACKEIGWFPVSLTPEAAALPVFAGLPAEFEAFHWHGDTFDVPPGAVAAAASRACANQAFVWGGRVVGLQFHLESMAESVEALIANCGGDLTAGPFIQTPGRLRAPRDRFDEANRLMAALLDNLAAAG